MCKLVIDLGSCGNEVSKKAIQKLGLEIEKNIIVSTVWRGLRREIRYQVTPNMRINLVQRSCHGCVSSSFAYTTKI